MERHGFGSKTFRVETDTAGELLVHRIDGQFNDTYYQKQTPNKVWKEIKAHFDTPQHVYICAIDISTEFIGTSNIRGEGESCGDGSTVWHGGGKELIIPASGHCFNVPLVAHELGHGFELEHDFRDDGYIMSYGQHRHRLSKCAAEWLNVHRLFNQYPHRANPDPPTLQMLPLKTAHPNGIRLQFKINDAKGLYQAHLLIPTTSFDPAPYLKLDNCYQFETQSNTFEFVSTELFEASQDEVVLHIIDRQGGLTWHRFPINIADRLPSLTTVSIPDPNLASAVRKALGLSPNVPIPQRAIANLRELDARKSKIKQLTGLEHATRLRMLELRENQIRDITPLANLKSLKNLILENNPISNISPLTNLTQLELLLMGGNPISDITPLKNLTELEGLALWGSNVSDVTLLAAMTKLTDLWLGDNNISDITPLANLTQLKVLELRDNQIRNVNPLVDLKKLEELSLRGNPIQDMSPLRTLLKQNPNLKVDIEIPQPSPIVHIGAAERPPMYWINASTDTLHRLIDDEVENLAPNVKNVTGIAVDAAGEKLYWTERTGERTGRIRRANLNGTNVQLVKNLTSVPHSLALDATNGKVYVTNAWGKVQRLNVDGSNFQPNLITGLDTPRNLVVDVASSKVYWTETTEVSGRIRRANLDGSSVQNVATGLAAPLSLAVAKGKVYWTSDGKLQRAHLDGTNNEVLETLPTGPTSIAVDTVRNALYLTLPSGDIHRRDLDGSGAQPVVTGLVSPSNIVLGTPAIAPVPPDTPVPPTTPVVDVAADVNRDKKVNKTDLLLVVTALGESPPANPNFDVNADGTVNIADVLLVIEVLDDPVAADAPSFGETKVSLDPALLSTQIDILRAESDGSLKYEHAIAFFQGLLASIRPAETQLLANYPNLFNPETWIPYHLATSSDVRIT